MKWAMETFTQEKYAASILSSPLEATGTERTSPQPAANTGADGE